MRTPDNDTGELTEKDAGDGGARDPVRRCVLTGEHDGRDALIRLALGPDGAVHPDIRARAPGRGAWIGADRATFDAALAKGRLRGALARAFKGNGFTLSDDLGARITDALRQAALDRLGLEARAGTLLTGAERIAAAARAGKLAALLHARDAGADGRRKLDQAWRVGSDAEGSGRHGVELPFDRTILSLALGRENVVSIGLTDARAAHRVTAAVERLVRFVGTDTSASPCGTLPQGSSATATQAAPATTIED